MTIYLWGSIHLTTSLSSHPFAYIFASSITYQSLSLSIHLTIIQPFTNSLMHTNIHLSFHLSIPPNTQPSDTCPSNIPLIYITIRLCAHPPTPYCPFLSSYGQPIHLLYTHPSTNLSFHLPSIHLSIHLPVTPLIYPPVFPIMPLPLYTPVSHILIYSFIHLLIHPY